MFSKVGRDLKSLGTTGLETYLLWSFIDVTQNQSFLSFAHIYPPFRRKRIVSLSFRWDVLPRLGVTISEASGPPVFHIKVGASR